MVKIKIALSLIILSQLVLADCFQINEKITKEIDASPNATHYVDKKGKDFLITTTCQRTNLTPKTLLAPYKEMGQLTNVNDKFSYLKVIGKKPTLIILYSFGKEAGTYLFVSNKLSPEKSLEKIKETIDSGVSKEDLNKIKL